MQNSQHYDTTTKSCKLTWEELLNAQQGIIIKTTYRVQYTTQRMYLNSVDSVKRKTRPSTTYSMNAHASNKLALTYSTINPSSTLSIQNGTLQT